jgi:hypothetical protein
MRLEWMKIAFCVVGMKEEFWHYYFIPLFYRKKEVL